MGTALSDGIEEGDMSEDRGREGGKGSQDEEDPPRREAQGDLLAEVMMGAYGESQEEAPGRTADPEEETEPQQEPRTRFSAGHETEKSAELEPDVPADSAVRTVEAAAHEPTVADPDPLEADLVLEGEDSRSSPEEPLPDTGTTTLIPPDPWEQKMAWAKERARDGRRKEAEDLYRELMEEKPESVRVRNNLGVLLDEKGDHEEAVVQFRAARSLDPRNQEVMGNLGAALGALGRFGEAEEELRAAVRLDPSNLQVRANLGILFFRRGLYEQAQTELGAVCEADPDHGVAFFYRGEALNRLGKIDEAIQALEQSLELWPENPKAYYTLGVLFDKKNRPERASVMYRKAREHTRR